MKKIFAFIVISACFVITFVSCSDVTLRPIKEKIDVDTHEESEVLNPPIAHAGNNITVQPDTTVMLDGSLSYDPMGFYPLSYYWVFANRPSNSRSVIQWSTTQHPTVHIDVPGTFIFELDVQNSVGIWSAQPNQVIVFSEEANDDLNDFRVMLSWNTGVDLDLHLAHDDEDIYKLPYDCNFCNRRPTWGDPESTLDNPVYNVDFTAGYGPEEIYMFRPSPSTYRISILRFGNGVCSGNHCEDTRAVVTLYYGSSEVARWSKLMPTNKEVWDVAHVIWPSREIIDIDETYATDRWACY